MEKIQDLIAPRQEELKIQQDQNMGLYVLNATEVPVGTLDEVLEVLEQGSRNRVTAATKANPVSSRSHALLLATIHKYDSEEHLSKYSQLYMVDLAGSEKVSKTGAEGMRLDEAKTINK